MIPCVGYAVRSKKDERSRSENTGGSTAQQEREVRARLSGDPDRALIAFFKEDGYSGFKGNRGPKLAAAIHAAVLAAEKHGNAELWAFISSRFGRGSGLKGEARALGALFYELRDKGVALRTVADDEFVTNEMLIGFASKQASKYVEDLSANVKRGKDDQFARGVWLGGPIPDGWRAEVIVEAGRTRSRLVRDPEREPVIRFMLELAREGWGQPTIAKKMREAGLRTRTTVRKDGTMKDGKLWDRRAVQDILQNPVYAGAIVRHRGKPSQEINWHGEHRAEAYLSREEWDALQAGFKSRDRAAKGRPKSGQPTTRYALARLAECNVCGHRMYAATAPYERKDGTHQRKYYCGNHVTREGTCDAPWVDATQVDAWIVDDLHALTFDFDAWFARVTASDNSERALAERELADVRDRLNTHRQRARKLQTKLVALIEHDKDDMAEAVAESLADLKAEVGRLEAAADRLNDRIASEPDHSDAVDGALDWWNLVRRQIDGAKLDARSLGDVNDLLKELFTAFRLEGKPDGHVYIEAVFRLPDDVAHHPWDENDDSAFVSDTFLVPEGAARGVLVGNPRNTQALRRYLQGALAARLGRTHDSTRDKSPAVTELSSEVPSSEARREAAKASS